MTENTEGRTRRCALEVDGEVADGRANAAEQGLREEGKLDEGSHAGREKVGQQCGNEQ